MSLRSPVFVVLEADTSFHVPTSLSFVGPDTAASAIARIAVPLDSLFDSMFAKCGCKAPRRVEVGYQAAEQLRRETHLTLIDVSLRVLEHTGLTGTSRNAYTPRFCVERSDS